MRNNSSVNSIEEAGNYALVQAARSGNIATVKSLLEEGVNPNSICPISRTPALNIAAYCGHAEIVKTLLRAGANVEAAVLNQLRSTSLMHAAHQGHVRVVDILLKAGADIFAKDYDGNMVIDYLTKAEEIGAGSNPLFTIQPRLEILNLITARRESYYHHFAMLTHITESHLADENRREDRRKAIQLVNEVSESGNIIQGLADFLRFAIEMNDQFLIEAILQAAPGHGFQEEKDRSNDNEVSDEFLIEVALRTALDRDFPEGGENVYRVTGRQKIIARALTDAAVKGQTEIIEGLSTLSGFYIDAMDRYDRTALMCAAEGGCIKTIRALLLLGADINGRGRFGKTPLHYAVASNGDSSLIKELINRGADVNARGDLYTFFSHPSLDYLYSDVEIIGRLSVLDFAIRLGNVFAIRELLDAGAALNEEFESFLVTVRYGKIREQSKANWRPLALALGTYEGNMYSTGKPVEIVSLLLERGANPDLLIPQYREAYERFMTTKTFAMSNMPQIMEVALRGEDEDIKTISEVLAGRNIYLIGYNAAIALEILLPKDSPISHRIIEHYKLNKGEVQKEVQRLRMLQAELVWKFAEKGSEQDPQLAAKIATAAFASYSTQSLFSHIVDLVSGIQARGRPTENIIETIHSLAKNPIPGFTPYHTSAVVEVVMERAHQVKRGRVSNVLMPASAPTLATAQNLIVMQREVSEGQGEEKGL